MNTTALLESLSAITVTILAVIMILQRRSMKRGTRIWTIIFSVFALSEAIVVITAYNTVSVVSALLASIVCIFASARYLARIEGGSRYIG